MDVIVHYGTERIENVERFDGVDSCRYESYANGMYTTLEIIKRMENEDGKMVQKRVASFNADSVIWVEIERGD